MRVTIAKEKGGCAVYGGECKGGCYRGSAAEEGGCCEGGGGIKRVEIEDMQIHYESEIKEKKAQAEALESAHKGGVNEGEGRKSGEEMARVWWKARGSIGCVRRLRAIRRHCIRIWPTRRRSAD